jgi:hypothetical protein
VVDVGLGGLSNLILLVFIIVLLLLFLDGTKLSNQVIGGLCCSLVLNVLIVG